MFGGSIFLNFNIFWVLGKTDYFWGVEIFMDIFVGSLKLRQFLWVIF